MKFISKIFCITLLVLSVNSFAKAETRVKLFSKNVEELVKNLNIAYEKRDGGALYDLLSGRSAYKTELTTKRFMQTALRYLTKQLQENPGDQKVATKYKLIKALLKSKRRAFFEKLFELMVFSAADKMPAKINLSIEKKELKKGFANLYLKNYKSKRIKVIVIELQGNWKVLYATELLDVFFNF